MRDLATSIESRIGPVWTGLLLELNLSRESVGGIRHLAAALLMDQDVRQALIGVGIPDFDRLRLALTKASPPSEQGRNLGVQISPNVRVTNSPSGTLESDFLEAIDSALGSDTIAGLPARVRLLKFVLQDPGIRNDLSEILDIDSLDTAVRDALSQSSA